jgi:dihydrofolate reductase
MKVILMMAQSVDGIVARDKDHFTEWTCSSDKRLFKRITQEAGVLVMGSRTYATIGKPLPGRLNVIFSRHPERLPQGEGVLFTRSAPRDLLNDLWARGYKKTILGGGPMINSIFARDRLIDEILVTVSPRIFGSGLTLFAEPLDLNLSLISTDRLDHDTVLLHYRVIGNDEDG